MRMVFIKTVRLKKLLTSFLILLFLLSLAGFKSASGVSNAYPVTSWALANRVIVIDPGHGGIDPGAVGYGGLKEKEIVLQVSRQLKQILSQSGAKVLLTRDSDIDLSSVNSGSLLSRKRDDLSKRVKLANQNKADLFLSIHVNAFPSGRWRGAQTFYQTNDGPSKQLALAVQSQLVQILKNTTRAAKPEDFYTTRNTKMPSVLIEIGFISNPDEARLMTDQDYQKRLAFAIYSGLTKYYAEQLPEP